MSGVEWSVRDYVYVIAECVTGVLSVLGNVLVLLAIKRTRSLRTVTNCFIGSLAAADALVGLVIPPTVILPYLGLPKHFYGCVLVNSLVVLITNISILSLLAVALERFLAVKNPFLYQRTMTVKRAMLVVVITWVIAIVTGLIPTMGWNVGDEGFTTCSFSSAIDLKYMVYLNFFGMTLPLLLAMLVIYLYIFHVIRKQKQRTKIQMHVLSRSERHHLKQRRQEVRGAKGLAYVIILFAVCWMPIHIMNNVTVFAPETIIPFEWVLGAIILSHANSVVNPFLYAFSNTKFKHAMKNILCCGSGLASEFDTTVESSRIRQKLLSLMSKTTNEPVITSPAVISNTTTIHREPPSLDSCTEELTNWAETENDETMITAFPVNGDFGTTGISCSSDHVWMTPSSRSLELMQSQSPHTQQTVDPPTVHTYQHTSKENIQGSTSEGSQANARQLNTETFRCGNGSVIQRGDEKMKTYVTSDSESEAEVLCMKPENTVFKEEIRGLDLAEENMVGSPEENILSIHL